MDSICNTLLVMLPVLPVFPCAGMQNEQRTLVQQQWMDGQVPVIVATVSFGMGVDKANVRFVFIVLDGNLSDHLRPFSCPFFKVDSLCYGN